MKNVLKKLSAFLIIAVMIFCMTGCIRYRTDMSVKSNGKADIEFIYAIYSDSSDEDDEDDEDGTFDSDDVKKLEDLGWEVDKYKKDGYVGVSLTLNDVKLDDLEEILTDKELEDVGFKDFTLEKKGSTYILDWNTHAKGDLDEEGIDLSTLSQYGGYMQFNLELPNKAIKENATEVSKDGKTLTWDLTEEDEIHCEFKVTNFTGIIIAVCVILAILVIAAVVVVLLVLKKKKSPAIPEAAAPASPVAPVAPEAPSFEAPASEPVAAPVVPEESAMPSEPVASEPASEPADDSTEL